MPTGRLIRDATEYVSCVREALMYIYGSEQIRYDCYGKVQMSDSISTH